MVARRRVGRIGPVTGQTPRTGMTGAAALGTRRGRLGMQLGKIAPVRSGPLPMDRRSLPAAGAGRVDRLHAGREPAWQARQLSWV